MPFVASAASAIPAMSNNFGTASNWVGAGQEAFSAAVGSGATGTLAVIGSALPWVGAGLAVASIADNLIRCGTIGQVGCQKVAAAKLTEAAVKACFQVVWDYEQGKASYSQAVQFIQQSILAKLQTIHAPRWSLTGVSPNHFGTFCSILWRIAPRTSQTAMYLCPPQPKGAMANPQLGDRGGALGRDASLYDVIQSCLQALTIIRPPQIHRPPLTAQAMASQASAGAAGAAAGSSPAAVPAKSSISKWLLLGALGAGVLLVAT